MEHNPGKRAGWRCVVKRRENQRRLWHSKRKHDLDYQLERQLNEFCRIRVR